MIAKRVRFFLLASLLAYLAYGIVLSRYDLQFIEPSLRPRNAEGFYEYRGVIQVHSNRSTGSRSMAEIIERAQGTDLDFVIFTDLNVFEPTRHLEGYQQNLLVLVGGEYSYLDSRLLHFGAEREDGPRSLGDSQVFFTDRLSQINRPPHAGIFILAHPFKPGYQWTGDYPSGLDGLEVLNLKSIWENAWHHSRLSFLWTIFVYPFNPQLAFLRLFEPPRRELDLWDQLSRERVRIGFAGTDAEARMKLFGRNHIEFPSYTSLFRIVRNHVLLQSELTGQFELDRRKITEALQAGQFYMALDLLADPRGFVIVMRDEEGRMRPLGSTMRLRQNPELVVRLPVKPSVPFEVQVLRDGQREFVSNQVESVWKLTRPGRYRAMVRLRPTLPPPDGTRWIPWIMTNHLVVTE